MSASSAARSFAASTNEGAATARITSQVEATLSAPDLVGVIICPSNPWLSIDPILAVPGMREALRASGAPIIAVTPVIAGRAVKGPTAKITAELGQDPDVRSIARRYEGLIDGLIVDAEDSEAARSLPLRVSLTNTLMTSLEDKIALGRHCLAFCAHLKGA